MISDYHWLIDSCWQLIVAGGFVVNMELSNVERQHLTVLLSPDMSGAWCGQEEHYYTNYTHSSPCSPCSPATVRNQRKLQSGRSGRSFVAFDVSIELKTYFAVSWCFYGGTLHWIFCERNTPIVNTSWNHICLSVLWLLAVCVFSEDELSWADHVSCHEHDNNLS